MIINVLAYILLVWLPNSSYSLHEIQRPPNTEKYFKHKCCICMLTWFARFMFRNNNLIFTLIAANF